MCHLSHIPAGWRTDVGDVAGLLLPDYGGKLRCPTGPAGSDKNH